MKSVKKEMILVIGLLSIFATASLVSLCTSCNREPEIEYVQVEKTVYAEIERSQVDLNGVDVLKIGDNLYEFEFTATQYKNDRSQIAKVFEPDSIAIGIHHEIRCFLNGSFTSKPGYNVKKILVTHTGGAKITTRVLDNNYNEILPAYVSESRREYVNVDKEQIYIRFGVLEGVNIVRVTFSIR